PPPASLAPPQPTITTRINVSSLLSLSVIVAVVVLYPRRTSLPSSAGRTQATAYPSLNHFRIYYHHRSLTPCLSWSIAP
ncbi:hypothetical protein PIB30_040184, partial [Stylosanthes scabra]|nr:hypothetical protein [Stylosanthes scabra]